jgi:hypothetical protein
MVYRVPGIGYMAESLIAFVTLPRKFRDLNERLERLERARPVEPAETPDSVVATHIPAILNYVTSFAHTSRDLTRRFDELQRRVESASPPGGDGAPSTPRLRTATER